MAVAEALRNARPRRILSATVDLSAVPSNGVLIGLDPFSRTWTISRSWSGVYGLSSTALNRSGRDVRYGLGSAHQNIGSRLQAGMLRTASASSSPVISGIM